MSNQSTQVSKPLSGMTKASDLNFALDRRNGSLRKYVQDSLANNQTPEHFIATMQTLWHSNPKFVGCEPMTFLKAGILAANLGLSVHPAMQEAYFIPYNNKRANKTEIQLQFGYRAMIKLMYRSPKIGMVEAKAVHQDDEFRYKFGLNSDLHHVPCGKVQNHETLTHAYVIVTLSNGMKKFLVLSKEEIEQYRKVSPNQKDWNTKKPSELPTGIWLEWYAAMAMAKVIKQIAKTLPLEADVQFSLKIDGAKIDDDTSLEFDDSNNLEYPEIEEPEITVETHEVPANDDDLFGD